jgi:hypothetical protein
LVAYTGGIPYGTSGNGNKLSNDIGGFSVDIGQPYAMWTQVQKSTGTSANISIGISTRTGSSSFADGNVMTFTGSSDIYCAASLNATTSITSKYSGLDTSYFVGSGAYASWGHKSATSSTNYAILHESGGNLYLNASGGGTIHLRKNNGGDTVLIDTNAVSITGILSVSNSILNNGLFVNLASTASTTYYYIGSLPYYSSSGSYYEHLHVKIAGSQWTNPGGLEYKFNCYSSVPGGIWTAWGIGYPSPSGCIYAYQNGTSSWDFYFRVTSAPNWVSFGIESTQYTASGVRKYGSSDLSTTTTPSGTSTAVNWSTNNAMSFSGYINATASVNAGGTASMATWVGSGSIAWFGYNGLNSTGGNTTGVLCESSGNTTIFASSSGSGNKSVMLAVGNVSYLAANNNGGTAKVIAYQPFWANQGVNTVSVISTGVISAPYYMCGVESDTGSFDITSTYNTFVRLTSSTVTMTLGTASAYAGFYRRLMCGTSTVSLNITSACIYLQSGANYWYNGTPSFTMNAGPGSNCSIEIWCDGVNWYVRA